MAVADALAVIDGLVAADGLIVRVNVAVAVCAGDSLSVTVIVTGVAVATVEGVPVIAPVAELIVSPAGSPVADHLSAPAPPVAFTVAE